MPRAVLDGDDDDTNDDKIRAAARSHRSLCPGGCRTPR